MSGAPSAAHVLHKALQKRDHLKAIQSVMGHKDIQTTMDIYAEATEEKK